MSPSSFMSTDRKLQVGVKCFIKNAEGKYLLLQKAKPYLDYDKDFKWDIPGGRINTGEPCIEALRRELLEETGMILTEVERIVGAQDILRNPELHVVRLTFIASAEGEVKLDPKVHRDFDWFTLEEIRQMNVDHFLLPILKGELTDGWVSQL